MCGQQTGLQANDYWSKIKKTGPLSYGFKRNLTDNAKELFLEKDNFAWFTCNLLLKLRNV